jgi:hypothetical protein
MVVVVGAATSSGLLAAPSQGTSYLCAGDAVTGFALDKNTHTWGVSQFRPRKYRIKPPTKDRPGATIGEINAVMIVNEVGDPDRTNDKYCDKDFNQGGILFCSGAGDDFHFSRTTLRFVHYFPYGYIEGPNSFFGKEGESTPYLEIGTCKEV